MKFATIATSVLVASSVLGTAGVVSADSTVYTGKANVTVEAGKDAVLQIDKAPGKVEKDGTTLQGSDLTFSTVKLSDFLQNESQKSTATLTSGAFAVTNTKGVDWTLTANVTDFFQGDDQAKAHFNGNLKFGDTDITNGGNATLFTSTNTAETNFNNASHTQWTSPQEEASIFVPAGTKIGSYTADITYTLSTGTNSNTPSGTTGAGQE